MKQQFRRLKIEKHDPPIPTYVPRQNGEGMQRTLVTWTRVFEVVQEDSAGVERIMDRIVDPYPEEITQGDILDGLKQARDAEVKHYTDRIDELVKVRDELQQSYESEIKKLTATVRPLGGAREVN